MSHPRFMGRRPRRPAGRGVLALMLATAALLAAGCAGPKEQYATGFSTSQISGTLTLNGQPPVEGSWLVVAYLHEYTFVGLQPPQEGMAAPPRQEEMLTRPKARVAQIGAGGRFRVAVTQNTKRVDLLFVALGHQTQEYRFTQRLGVGDVTYTENLTPSPDWRSHYYTVINPLLSQLITEKKYQLPDRDQQLLVEWLAKGKKLADNPAQPKGGPTGQ